MTRGRPPRKGLDAAIPIAQERGFVMEFRQSGENRCEFIIIGNGTVAFVRVRKARRLHGTVAEIEEDFSEAVTGARSIPAGGPVVRELWLYSRFCVMRFFRITDDSLVKIDRSGRPLAFAVTGPVTPPIPVLPPAPVVPAAPATLAAPTILPAPALSTAPALPAAPAAPLPPAPPAGGTPGGSGNSPSVQACGGRSI
jgi:hypothetical protein